MGQTAAQLNAELVTRLRAECKQHRIPLDRFDADFIVGLMMEWLRQKDAALTGDGIKLIRRH